MQLKTIAILGAGFGGLAAARKLGKLFLLNPHLRGQYRILLINQHHYHLYSPLLYEAATTSLSLANNVGLESLVTLPISKAILDLPVEFLAEKVKKIDLKNESLILENESAIPWHYLVIACGTETNFYGIPGMKERSLPFKTFIDAVKARNAIEALFADPLLNQIRIVVSGGGFTGAELSAELAGWVRHLEKRYKKRGSCKIILCEAGPEILSALNPTMMEAVRARLEALGIIIRTDAPIKQVKKTSILLETGEKIPFDILIWTGGVKVPTFIANLGVRRNPKGRLEVNGAMNCITLNENPSPHKNIFAIGDIACYIDPKANQPTPGLAKAAIEQGHIAALNIVADIEGNGHKDYRGRQYSYIIPVGGKWAVAKMGPFVIQGLFGWVVKNLEELRYLIALLPNNLAFKTWAKWIWTFIRND